MKVAEGYNCVSQEYVVASVTLPPHTLESYHGNMYDVTLPLSSSHMLPLFAFV